MVQRRVLLADDHQLIRDAILHAVAQTSDMVVVGEATDGAQVAYLCQMLRPDVVLLDLSMGASEPLAMVRQVRQQGVEARILILSAYDNLVPIQELLAVGISGYALKDETTRTIVRALQTVAEGGTFFSHAVLQKMAGGQVKAPDTPTFSEREDQLLHHLASGASNAHIAEALHISEPTVRYHLRNIYDKMMVDGRGAAIAWAVRAGYGKDPD